MSGKATTAETCEKIGEELRELRTRTEFLLANDAAGRQLLAGFDGLMRSFTEFVKAFNEEKLQDRERQIQLKTEVEKLRTKLELNLIEHQQTKESLEYYRAKANNVQMIARAKLANVKARLIESLNKEVSLEQLKELANQLINTKDCIGGKYNTELHDLSLSQKEKLVFDCMHKEENDSKDVCLDDLLKIPRNGAEEVCAKLAKCKSEMNLNRRQGLVIRKEDLMKLLDNNPQQEIINKHEAENKKARIILIGNRGVDAYSRDKPLLKNNSKLVKQQASNLPPCDEYGNEANRSLLKSYLHKDRKKDLIQRLKDNNRAISQLASNTVAEVETFKNRSFNYRAEENQPVIVARSYGNQHSEVNVSISILNEKGHKQLLRSRLSASKPLLRYSVKSVKKQGKRCSSMKLVGKVDSKVGERSVGPVGKKFKELKRYKKASSKISQSNSGAVYYTSNNASSSLPFSSHKHSALAIDNTKKTT